jgi:hypothetical protein
VAIFCWPFYDYFRVKGRSLNGLSIKILLRLTLLSPFEISLQALSLVFKNILYNLQSLFKKMQKEELIKDIISRRVST